MKNHLSKSRKLGVQNLKSRLRFWPKSDKNDVDEKMGCLCKNPKMEFQV
jgi:hypothetical protein